jgi:phospholipid/cholesterol/gamma-HCH transport system ATP-binding protein
MASDVTPRIEVRDLDMIFGGYVVQKNISLSIAPGEIFVIMGGSGCGKSSLLRHMTGLVRPVRGEVYYDGTGYWGADEETQAAMRRRFGVLFQAGALWSSMTLAENVALPLSQYTKLSAPEIVEVVALKLSLVGLHGFQEYYPSQISGGMRKRAGLARAMALDPDILFFDEPSAGLDPISSKRLDDLILELRDSLGATVIMVTHELASIFAVADNAIFLDAETRTPIAHGNPRLLRDQCPEQKVRDFLMRGELETTAA